jgi:glycosyltransferase involved in cell wall biosynthesis
MRIAYVINSVEGGGAAAPVPDIADVIEASGAEFRLFALTPRDRRALPAIEAAGLQCRVRQGGEADHFAALRWLDDHVAAWQPTHIWTSLTRATLLGQLVGLRRRLPVVSWQHAAYLKPWNRRLLRATQRLSALWIGDSEYVTDLTSKRLHVPSDRLVCWPIFATDHSAPPAVSWRFGDTVRIGSLGRLHPVKGYDVLIAALAILKAEAFLPAAPFEVAIAGDGAQRDELEAAIAREGLSNVHLVGYCERPQRFLAGLHLYVQPSRSEGFCIAAHEAMQAGLPVVASAVGEMQYSIDRLCGSVVPPDDPKALARALANLLLYPDMLGSLGDAARRRANSRFSREAFVARGREVMERVSSL